MLVLSPTTSAVNVLCSTISILTSFLCFVFAKIAFSNDNSCSSSPFSPKVFPNIKSFKGFNLCTAVSPGFLCFALLVSPMDSIPYSITDFHKDFCGRRNWRCHQSIHKRTVRNPSPCQSSEGLSGMQIHFHYLQSMLWYQ